MNPSSGSSHVAPRSLIINSLTAKTSEYMASGLIRFRSCAVDKQNVLVHILIGSESVPNFFYDVVIEFRNYNQVVNGKVVNGISKDKTDIKVFSNSPEFVFTYGYSFNQRGYLISKYKHLIGNEALTKAPVMKNPNKEIGMSTSLFVALKYLDINGFFGSYAYVKFVNGVYPSPRSFNTIQMALKSHKRKK